MNKKILLIIALCIAMLFPSSAFATPAVEEVYNIVDFLVDLDYPGEKEIVEQLQPIGFSWPSYTNLDDEKRIDFSHSSQYDIVDILFVTYYQKKHPGKVSYTLYLDLFPRQSSEIKTHLDNSYLKTSGYDEYTLANWGTTSYQYKYNDTIIIYEILYQDKSRISSTLDIIKPNNAIQNDSHSTTSKHFSIRNGICFGMTREEVISIEGTPLVNRNDIVMYLTEAGGLEAGLGYIFGYDDKLHGIQYIFSKTNINQEKYIHEFEDIDNLLTEKYGKPNTSAEIWENDLYKSIYSSMPGTAMVMGYLKYITMWQLEDVQIIHYLQQGDEAFTAAHSIMYDDINYDSPVTNQDSGL